MVSPATPIPIQILDAPKKLQLGGGGGEGSCGDDGEGMAGVKGGGEKGNGSGGVNKGQTEFSVSSYIFIPQKFKGSAKTSETLYKELFPTHPIPPSIFLTSE